MTDKLDQGMDFLVISATNPFVHHLKAFLPQELTYQSGYAEPGLVLCVGWKNIALLKALGTIMKKLEVRSWAYKVEMISNDNLLKQISLTKEGRKQSPKIYAIRTSKGMQTYFTNPIFAYVAYSFEKTYHKNKLRNIHHLL